MILRHLIGSDKRDGFFVDIGAFHPSRSSNTYFFYLNGWTGINIDACPGSMKKFKEVRPRDINLEVGVSDQRGELTYYFIDDESSANSFSREFLASLGMLKFVTKEIKVPVVTLTDILDEHFPIGRSFDFMSVDVEGLDYNVLASNDWEKYRPRFIVVEDLHQEGEHPRVLSFLRSHDYDVCARNVIIMNRVDEYFLVDRRTLQ